MKNLHLITKLAFLVLMLTACATPQGDSTSQIASSSEPVLEMIGLDDTKSLTMADLQALGVIEGWGGTKSSAGVISPPQRLKGVTVEKLATLVGGLEPGMGISIIAKDGYAMTMSYDQIANGDFVTYDPGTGDENEAEGLLQTIIAFERDGEPISADDDGPLRLFIISENNDNVVDGHWTVKWVTQVKLKPMSEEWSLYLEGAITEQMDRNTFESCSAPGCHQATWTDESGNIWSGVPLYYLAGRIDDGLRHEDRAYNDEFAKAGYVMQLFASDGYNVAIESKRTDFNRHIFVSSVVNGQPLDDKHYPLRLVGDGLEKSEMIGQIAQIIIQPDESVAMPSGEPPAEDISTENIEMVLPEGAALMVYGKVVNHLTLGVENLQAMQVVDLEAEHPKKGLQSYQGIRLNDLLDLAGLDSNAALLVITASDGYQTELNLKEVRDCLECLVALLEDGSLSMVMPGLDSNFWVKQVIFLEIE